MKSEIRTETAFYLHRYFYNKGNKILSVVSLPQNDPPSPAVAGYAEVNKLGFAWAQIKREKIFTSHFSFLQSFALHYHSRDQAEEIFHSSLQQVRYCRCSYMLRRDYPTHSRIQEIFLH